MEYEVWCTIRVLEALDELPDDALHRDFGFGLRTPHRTAFHVVDVMGGWSGCVGPAIRAPVWAEYDTAVAPTALRAEVVRIGRSWGADLRASHEVGVLEDERRLHQTLHLVTHGSHHRGQLLSMLTLLGVAHPYEGGDFAGWSR